MGSNKFDLKLVFCPSNPPKIAENDMGISRRINLKPMKRGKKNGIKQNLFGRLQRAD